MNMSLSKLWEAVKDKEAWRAEVHRIAKSQTHWAAKQQQGKVQRQGWALMETMDFSEQRAGSSQQMCDGTARW